MRAGEHLQCLDVVKVAPSRGAGGALYDCAILIEIWDSGALLQTSIGIPEGTEISLASIGDGILAKVISCDQDIYGFLIQIAILGPDWFPEVYQPPHVLWA